MRKVSLGLIEAALSVSAAQTAPVLGCKLDGLELMEEPVTSASRWFRVSGHGIVGEVVTQDGPWTVTVQQDRGRKVTAATTLLAKA